MPNGSVGMEPAIFALEVFTPIDVRGVCRRTEITRGIHHYAMRWAKPSRRIAKWLSWYRMRGALELLLKWRH